jgi:hypothetical protein
MVERHRSADRLGSEALCLKADAIVLQIATRGERHVNSKGASMKRLILGRNSKRAAMIASAAIAALVVAGCGLPTGTVMNGAGTFSTSSGPGQISLSYRVVRADTGAGAMTGSYDDPAGMTVDGVHVPVQLSFVNATASICDSSLLPLGTSCTSYVQRYCSTPAHLANYSACVNSLADNACAATEFTYQAYPSALPVSGGLAGQLRSDTGEGVMVVCGQPSPTPSGGVFLIALLSGPYAHYGNEGELASGGFTSGGGVSSTPPVTGGSPSGPPLHLPTP